MSDFSSGTTLFPQRLAEDFVKQLNITFKACRLYPSTSDLPRVSAEHASAALGRLFERSPDVVLTVSRDGLNLSGADVFPRLQSFAVFGREFYARRVSEVHFHPGVTPQDIAALMGALVMPPEVLLAQGGFGAVIWEGGVSDITVTEVATHFIDGEIPEEETDESAPEIDDRDTEEIIRSAGAGHPRDRRTLVRLMHDRRVVADYLLRSIHRTRDVAAADASMGIGVLARAVEGEVPAEQERALQSLADAIKDLDPAARNELYRSRLLDEARRDESLAVVVRALGVDEVLDVLLAHVDETEAGRKGILRAIRNLSAVRAGMAGEPTIEAAARKMRTLGFDDADVGEMVRAASPDRVGIAETARPAGSRPVQSVLRLIEMTPDSRGVFVNDDSVQPLRDEAALGTTDGDILLSLVTVATIEERTAQFSRMMALVERGLTVLAETHEFEVAAIAVEALLAASERPEASEVRRERMRVAVRVLASARAMADVAAALRLYKPGSSENRACRKLLELLGADTVDSLLQVLADEQDMAARKTLVELVTEIAPLSIPQLASRLGDPRWFLVRNLVSMLAATRSADALPHLARTLKHSDARVRRETVRGLGGFRTRMASGMLAGALADEDAQNVQLAARLLGTLRAAEAVPALEEVARGEGRGNRDPAARIEAIGALAAIGRSGSVETLRSLARKRTVFGGKKGREVRAAAESALRTLEQSASAGGDA